MRLAKQLEKKLAAATDPEEASQIKADLHIAQVDIDYAIYYPFMEAYVSLYAGSNAGGKGEKDEKEDKSKADQYLRTPRPPMWAVIEETREKGKTALERLQNRRPQQQPAEDDASMTKEAKKGDKKGDKSQNAKTKAKSRGGGAAKETTRASDNDEDSDSDGGGFFE